MTNYDCEYCGNEEELEMLSAVLGESDAYDCGLCTSCYEEGREV